MRVSPLFLSRLLAVAALRTDNAPTARLLRRSRAVGNNILPDSWSHPHVWFTGAGLQKGDVVLSANGAKIADVASLLRQSPFLALGQNFLLVISCQQKEITFTLAP